MSKTWTVSMQVVAPDSETAESIEKMIENALDDDTILSEILDVTMVKAEPE